MRSSAKMCAELRNERTKNADSTSKITRQTTALGPPRPLGAVAGFSAARGRVWPRGSLAAFKPLRCAMIPGNAGRIGKRQSAHGCPGGEARASRAYQNATPRHLALIDRPPSRRPQPQRTPRSLPPLPAPCRRSFSPHRPAAPVPTPPPRLPSAPPRCLPPPTRGSGRRMLRWLPPLPTPRRRRPAVPPPRPLSRWLSPPPAAPPPAARHLVKRLG